MSIKAVFTRIIPKYTLRRLSAGLLITLFRQPGRLLQRLNSENIFLYKQFRKVRAHCSICGSIGGLYFDMPDRKLRTDHGIGMLRETLSCTSCGSTNRQRTLARALMDTLNNRFAYPVGVLKDLVANPRPLRIWDTDAFSPVSSVLQASGMSVVSKYLPGTTFGNELSPGLYNIDLQRISFESDRFDIILSSDIMEHVRDDNAAHREIFRCLKSGGAYIFTVPFNEDRTRTLRLVDASADTDIYLTCPHFHGDPLTGGILAYRIYGRDLIANLEEIGFSVQFMWLDRPTEGIFGGDCFVATKP